jgi:hypothetical protein
VQAGIRQAERDVSAVVDEYAGLSLSGPGGHALCQAQEIPRGQVALAELNQVDAGLNGLVELPLQRRELAAVVRASGATARRSVTRHSDAPRGTVMAPAVGTRRPRCGPG